MTFAIEAEGLLEERRLRVLIDGDRIAAVEDLGAGGGPGPRVAPGLVDLQVNGCAGLDFNAPGVDGEAVVAATRHLWANATTSFLPTVITGRSDRIAASMAAIAGAAASDPLIGASIPGIHLEGPFISPENGPRGAHPAEHVRAPDWGSLQRWQESARGMIRLITLSPEWPDAARFIERCVESGLIVAIGHTAATGEEILEAVRAGARLSTHLGNGAHPMIPRHTGYLWEQLACDDLTASLIADGAHLPTPVLRVMLRAKGERCLLVSDAVAATSLPPGEYVQNVGGRVLLTPDRRLVLADDPRLLAGSVRLLPEAVSHLVAEGLTTRARAWEMASVRPASLLGGEAALRAGAAADLVLLDWDGAAVRPRRVLKSGVDVLPAEAAGAAG
ncbi:MAG TPA: amidohydrolase family protein [Candidatus Dormibacteraeota bacterium]|jgi:N-acetylglucosamine-6-phosphate deacetylase|nr:amidohydrolase family protein [Candidatus Dormibacteraeota bacterium]